VKNHNTRPPKHIVYLRCIRLRSYLQQSSRQYFIKCVKCHSPPIEMFASFKRQSRVCNFKTSDYVTKRHKWWDIRDMRMACLANIQCATALTRELIHNMWSQGNGNPVFTWKETRKATRGTEKDKVYKSRFITPKTRSIHVPRKLFTYPMAFRSGQNYFKSTSNIQTLYQHVITLNIMLKISRWSSNSKKKIKRKFKAYTSKLQNTFQTSKDIHEN
jgi:hypothetical protein